MTNAKKRLGRRSFMGGVVAAAAIAGSLCAASAQEFTLRLAHIFPDTHPIGRGALALKTHVERESKGRVRISVFPAQQLGGLRSIEDAASNGLLDIAQAAAPTLQAIYKPASVLTLPYAFRDEAHLKAAWAGVIGQQMRSDMVKQVRLHIISSFPQPPRHLTATKAIKVPDDLKGVKIRVPEVPSWVAFFRKLGAVPVPIDLGEIVTSLQLGVVTAQENPFATIQSLKLADVQKFVIPTGHVRTFDFFVLSDATYQKLPEDLRKVVIDGGKEAEKVVIENWDKVSESARDALVKAGMTLVEPDVPSFIKAQEGLYKEFLAPDLQKIYEEIQAIK
ncbi:MAG: TRAP transporter substrate-binding protein [Hyphomicrobiales bacterium]|nr:TRAP transporter substrate-binding protein [Hyphomicrobiales bacterium]